ncbi:MAG: four helix bundle protein [Patescibacteria group bacterium]
MDSTFHIDLRSKINEYIHLVYKATRYFPKEELYGITSQLRRSSMSVMLNYIEGYARIKSKVHKNFIEISYGSLQESKYLIEFSFDEKYIPKEEYQALKELSEKIGAMLWGIIRNIK